LDERVIRLSG